MSCVELHRDILRELRLNLRISSPRTISLTVFAWTALTIGLLPAKCYGQPPSEGYENVTLKKSCNMSSSYKDENKNDVKVVCKWGINNDTEKDYNENNGIHTYLDDLNPWWEVYLGRLYPIHSITVWPRRGYPKRMPNVSIMVDNEKCFTFSSETDSQTSVCSRNILTGSVVRVIRNGTYTKNGDTYFININEIKVWSCKPAYWGRNCNNTCGICTIGQVCDKINGSCDSCSPGWKPPLCREACDDGTYGQNCSGKCFENCDGICDKVTGSCTCKPGWKPPSCDKACDNRTWGLNCAVQCGVGCTTDQCDPSTGSCTCKPGWQAPMCKDECTLETYGQDCAYSCGSGCNSTLNSRVCDLRNGTCSCQSGWQPPMCEKRIGETEHNNNAGTIVGLLVAILCLLIVTVLLVLFIRKRRLKKEAMNLQTSSHIYQNVTIHNDIPEAQQNEEDTKLQNSRSAANQTNADHVSTPKEISYINVSKSKSVTLPAAMKLPPLSDKNDIAVDEQTEDEETIVDNREDLCYNDDIYVTSTISHFQLDTLQKFLLQNLREGTFETEFKALKNGLQKAHKSASAQVNHYKNRFQSILPYDSTRVVLQNADKDFGKDYINASYISGCGDVAKAYIAAQGPRNNTVDDFWSMIWQEKITHIVMLTNVKEADKVKCEQYWPAMKEKKTFGRIEVTGVKMTQRSDFVVREFDVSSGQSEKPRRVRQYHYVTWPDHAVPSTTALVDFWHCVRTDHRSQPQRSPLLVHCSAGIGRTGTYIALDISFDHAQSKSKVDLYKVVGRLREDRCSMVQGLPQYRFLHEALLEAYTARNSRMTRDAFDKVFPKEIQPDNYNSHIDKEYQLLQQMKMLLNKPKHDEAEKKENVNKIRNASLLPDDRHLVYLSRHVPGRNQYIHAVYVPTFFYERGAILTQLPTTETKVDFWRLVEGSNVKTIVCLGEITGIEVYWPCLVGDCLTIGPYKLELKHKNKIGEYLTSYSLINTFTKDLSFNSVELFHYSAWSGEIPANTSDVLQLLDTLTTNDKSSDPLLIQCFDGVSKSGLFSALCDVLARYTRDRVVDAYTTARRVQTIRPECITSVIQYRYLFYLIQADKRRNEVYANV